MKGIIREYWFNVLWAVAVISVGIYYYIDYKGTQYAANCMFIFGFAFIMLIPVMFAVYDKVRGDK